MQQLHELAKLDTYWRKLALLICKCPTLADDLVQNMYFKMIKRNPQKWNKTYVYRTIYNLYMDELRRTKKLQGLEYIKVSIDPKESDCVERVIQTALDSLGDTDLTKAVMINMDNTVRATANKMGYSAYKLWSKVKAVKDELKEDGNLKAAYELLKKGEL